MKFCAKLLTEINFEPDAIQPCCDVQKIKVPRFPFSGGEFNVADYVAFLQDAVRKVQTGELCAGCSMLKDAEDTAGQQFRLAAVTFNQHRFRCNCKCVYCSLWNHQRREETTYSVLPAITSLLNMPNVLDKDAWFHWGGGEPVILPEFNEACGLISNNGHKQYIHSSGLKFSPAIAELLAKGLGGINISLDSGSPEVYEKVKGLPGFAKVTENIRKYVQAATSPMQVSLKYIIFEPNNSVAEITRFFDLCGELGIREVDRSFDFRDVNAGKVSEKSLVAAAYFATQAKRRSMHCFSFYIAPDLQAKIDAIAREHFSR
ncbi:radical SAM protein [Desulfovibrio sp. OttesenSCG-928-G15]|nr:radical SAM protein [Desulfovibrio sp. OttesenSCG-928-G15]